MWGGAFDRKSHLVLDFSFDELKNGDTIIRDSSSFKNHGSLKNIKPVRGKFKNGIDLSSNSWVEIRDNDSLDLTDNLTLMGWFYFDAFTSEWNRMIVKSPVIDYEPWIIYGLYQRGQTFSGEIVFGLSINDNQVELYSDALVTEDRWIHITATYNGENMRIYFNGLEVNQRAVSGKIDINDIPVVLGRNHIGRREQFIGKMDEISIWNIALTEDQINEEIDRIVQNEETETSLFWCELKRRH